MTEVTTAQVEQSAPNKPPILTPGDLTPRILQDWQAACEDYFIHKAIADEDKVKYILGGMKDPNIREWVTVERAALIAMTFEDYMALMRSSWLEDNWEHKIRRELLSSRQGDKPFWQWQAEVRNLNATLQGTTSHKTNTDLLYLLESGVNDDLATELKNYPVATTSLKTWVESVKVLDERVRHNQQRIREMFNDMARTERLKRQAYRASQTPFLQQPSSSKGPTTMHSTPTLGAGSSPATSRVPKLMDDERNLLMVHKGCFKCRQFYVGHTRNNCPTGFPSASTYTHLTEAMAQKARANVEPVQVKSEPVASLGVEQFLDDTEYVTLDEPHLRPKLSIGDVTFSVVLPITPMIDNGSPSVLITPELCDKLGLHRHCLPHPSRYSQAFTEKTPTIKEWVKFKVKSIDGLWISETVRAKVAPNLCTSLILGIPFLSSNKLVIDHEDRTVIDKSNGYDLMAQTPKSVIAAVNPEQDMTPELEEEDRKMKELFSDRFPIDIPHTSQLPTNVYHRIPLRDEKVQIYSRPYACPKKYRESWKTLIDQHLAAGRIRPSSSPFASPSFIIPKADPTVLPRWVIDYRQLNANTIPDRTPLPRMEEILGDCAKGKFFAKIDMTNSFFQTRVHPDDIWKTATSTPFGLFEWTVMPMGFCNSPATHQRRMNEALRPLIGEICHAYLDDIIIWSQTLEEHKINVAKVLGALRKAHLYCSPKKTRLFLTKVHFLGQIVSSKGLEADPARIERLLNWPVPTSTTEMRRFLGLVRSVAEYLPHLAEHNLILSELTKKEYDIMFPQWEEKHQKAFDSMKELVVGRDCLTTIPDDDSDPNQKVFVTTDASDRTTGGIISVGKDWETSRPAAFDSMQMNAAQRNYPVHEKELLAIIRALQKWRVHLLGRHFDIYTDHRTLEHLPKQRDLSRRQARWMEFLSQYDFDLHYLKGDENLAADALSRSPDASPAEGDLEVDDPPLMALLPELWQEFLAQDMRSPISALTIMADPDIVANIKEGYKVDAYCIKLLQNLHSLPNVHLEDGLLYTGSRLIIPKWGNIRELLFQAAHDALGHFGFDKAYGSLRDAYFWPGMRTELEDKYIPSCTECQRNKSTTHKPTGPLHPLPIPDKRFDSVAIDFIGPLPEDKGYNGIMTMTDRLGAADVQIKEIRMNMTAEQLAKVFFDNWYCENGLPLEIISDRDHLFNSKFWEELHKLTRVKIKMSSAYHPETDGASERTNKTINQLLRYHVNRNQKNWVSALPCVRFGIMNTVNTSTGFSPFQLKSGFSPRVLPPLTQTDREEILTGGNEDKLRALEVFSRIEQDVQEAQDNLFTAKTRQAHHANTHRDPEHPYAVGDWVMLSTKNRRKEYMQKGKTRVAKFMPRFDGPYKILTAFPEKSSYTLQLPNSSCTFPGFHASQLKPYHENDASLFPEREAP
jgi:RNase H-like domain found in reverse transcriptase/Reverse transcriptase (RNA-dependent DNA polymerase)/Integrase zinc binding domain